MEIHERIYNLRQTLKLTRADFGTRLGLSGDVINNMERGRIKIMSDRVKLICATFHVNEQWLREGIGDMFVPDPDSELEALAKKYNLSLRQKLLVRHYLELDERQRAAVMQFMFDLVDECRKEEEEKEPTIDELVEDYRRQLEEERASRGEGGMLKEDTPKKGAS